MPSTSDFLAATTDPDLIRRIQAAAQIAGIANADQWAQANLVAVCLHDANGSTIVDVYAYASDVRRQYVAATPPPPGLNPGAVTDPQLTAAIEALRPVQ
jgi:hypothetical protein